jgi:uncharacterized protein (DUF488 family)
MKLYTIGFTQKNAETFFGLLRQNHVARLVDIRLNPDGQLSGFAKREDLPYFLTRLVDGCAYERILELAPTKEILGAYRKSGDWTRYMQQFEALLDERNVPTILDQEVFRRLPSCLLCSESTPKQCHRRLVAERMAAFWPDVEIIHL